METARESEIMHRIRSNLVKDFRLSFIYVAIYWTLPLAGHSGSRSRPHSPFREAGANSEWTVEELIHVRIRLNTAEIRSALALKCVDSLAKVIGGAQATITMAFELDGGTKQRVLGVVEQLFCGALRQW